MLKKIALAVVLFQVAIFSALLTQTVLFASSTATQAANVQPGASVDEARRMTEPPTTDPLLLANSDVPHEVH